MHRSHFKAKSPRKKLLSATVPQNSYFQKWRGGIIITVWIVFSLVCVVVLFTLSAEGEWKMSINNRLLAWQNAYQLSDSTIVRFREIELQFHGSGNPFTSPIEHSDAEIKLHHKEMAALMEPKTGERFLNDLSSGRWQH